MQNTKKKKLARKQTSSATRNSRLLSFQGPGSSLYRTESSLKRTVPFQLREEPKRRLHPSSLGMQACQQ